MDDLIAGFALDTDGWRPRSQDDLMRYCYHVAGSVGCMMAIVMGVAPEDEATLDRACDLGLAFQLANIARDNRRGCRRRALTSRRLAGRSRDRSGRPSWRRPPRPALAGPRVASPASPPATRPAPVTARLLCRAARPGLCSPPPPSMARLRARWPAIRPAPADPRLHLEGSEWPASGHGLVPRLRAPMDLPAAVPRRRSLEAAGLNATPAAHLRTIPGKEPALILTRI